MNASEIKITVTCAEDYDVLLVDTSAAAHENVVRDYCETHACDACENVYTIDADEAEPHVVAAAIEYLRSHKSHESDDMIAALQSL